MRLCATCPVASASMAQYSHYSQSDPDFLRFKEAKPRPPRPSNPESDEEVINSTRLRTVDTWVPENTAAFKPYLPDDVKYEVQDHTVAVQGSDITVRVVLPSASKEKVLPMLVYFHGGSFFAGSIDACDYECRVLATKAQAVTVNVGYRTSPYPECVEDSYAALKWAIDNAATLCSDVQKGLIVMGSSAGGHLAAVMARRARDDPAFPARITGQVLQIPVVINPNVYPEQLKDRLLSMEQNADTDGFLGAEDVHRAYRFLGGNPKDPDVSPLLAPSLANLPRAFVQVDGLDPLRDEGILYADLLRAAGVEVKLEIYPGVPHAFEYMMPNTPVAKKFVKDTHDAVLWLLQ
ncbi:hypothetical protein PENSPDRAFT_463624 [Peniophora sp. CONT]|nr:hypothetical protein PENSPDRAFT_463624 [Peniophora sp. CONT]